MPANLLMPFSLHTLCSCYTTEFMLTGDKSDSDRFVYDPRKRSWIPLPHTPRAVHAAPE